MYQTAVLCPREAAWCVESRNKNFAVIDPAGNVVVDDIPSYDEADQLLTVLIGLDHDDELLQLWGLSATA